MYSDKMTFDQLCAHLGLDISTKDAKKLARAAIRALKGQGQVVQRRVHSGPLDAKKTTVFQTLPVQASLL